MLILMICVGVWLYRCYSRGEKLVWSGATGTSLTNLIHIWYDGASGKLSLRKDFTEPASITITSQKGELFAKQTFPENEKFFKIPLRGKLPSGLYTIKVTSEKTTVISHLKVRGCLIKIVDKNQL